MNPFRDIASLFFPPVCPVCGEIMGDGMSIVCNRCRWDAPLTNYWTQLDNPVARKFWGLLPVYTASSFLFFVHGNGFRSLIHDFKYRGRWRLAVQMGEWYGGELSRSGLYDGVDVVIPVPLHLRKRIKRGYNQSEYIARGIASQLNVPVDSTSIVRRRHNLSQTQKPHRERWGNVEDIFGVRNGGKLSGKHILLVDDVLTTGATVASCTEAIVKGTEDCRVSIATLAVSKHDIEVA